MLKTKQRSDTKQQTTSRRFIWGRRMIRFSGIVLTISAAVKFWHPAKAVAYMGSMGYEGETFYVIAILELLTATLFLLPATRRIGLLLLSSYYGGAIAAHLAVHRFFAGGPFLVYMARHPYVGAAIPGGLLILTWVGMYLHDSAVHGATAQSFVAMPSGGAHVRSAELSPGLAVGK